MTSLAQVPLASRPSAMLETAAKARPDISLLEGLRLIPPRVARAHGILPLRYDDDVLVVGARDANILRARDALGRLGHRRVHIDVIEASHFDRIMQRWYGPMGDWADYAAGLINLPHPPAPLQADDDPLASPAPRFLDLTLAAALAEGASDVHIEPHPKQPRIRFRVDGLLAERIAPPTWLPQRLIGRIKALADLALGESQRPQDGVFEIPSPKGDVAVRVSILPCESGECAVLRLLTPANRIPSLSDLGVPSDSRSRLEEAASAPHGLIILAGPTGSGKTTTLHALLETVDAARRNVVSIEDPVEIRSRRLRQVRLRRDVGLDFAAALRSVLRQDPDVILVGETRDPETAQLVLQAALAGHLVLTTVHASSALEVFSRFEQLGADRRLLAQVARLVASQRLLRTRCSSCDGDGCFTCEGSGLSGRTCVLECLPMEHSLTRGVTRGDDTDALAAEVRRLGYPSLTDHAQQLVQRGITTRGEVARVLDVAPQAIKEDSP